MMKALAFETSVPRYLLVSAIARVRPQVLFSNLAPTQMREIPEPALKGDDWVKIRPRLSGLCGTDMGIVLCRQSTTLEPFASYPMILGHEVSGEIAEKGAAVRGFEVGDRVTVMPMISCAARGIDPPCKMCARGRTQLCENFTVGLSPGIHIGVSADGPGFISEMGLAHVSNLHRAPDNVSDENVMLAEPFGTCLHAVINNEGEPGETVLVFGCGVLGLGTIAALRALRPDCRILAVEVSPFHSEMVLDMGAEEVIRPGKREFYKRIAELTGAKMLTGTVMQPMLVGGVDRVFDTVSSTDTINSSLRVLANGGRLNMMGLGTPKRIDWTPVWLKELTVRGVLAYQDEVFEGEKVHDIDLALRLFSEGRVDLSHMVTHRFTLDQWPLALETALDKGKHRAIKIAFTH
jgi:threonine dehydrogenase-like Zn-dependent dehydrogenase